MKVTLPKFREGIEWRRLTKQERRGKPWKYVLLTDVFVWVNTGLDRHYDCRSGDGRTWMVLMPLGVTMCEGYAWNGNSFSPDSLLGVLLLLQSLPHDGLFQFSGAVGFPLLLTLPWVNWLYLMMSPRWIGWAYYAGLVAGSWALWRKAPENGDHVESHSLQ